MHIDNKSGGGGVPAMQEVARAPADGHKLILGHVGSLAVNPYIFANTGYDVNRNFATATIVGGCCFESAHQARLTLYLTQPSL